MTEISQLAFRGSILDLVKELIDLDNLDRSSTDKKYWDAVLKKLNLGMRRGIGAHSYGEDYDRSDYAQQEKGGGHHVRRKKTLAQIERDKSAE